MPSFFLKFFVMYFGACARPCALAVVVLSWLSSTRVASPWRRAALIALRAGAAACALVLFLEPAIELRQVAREPNRVAVLVDDSLSMSLRDQADGPQTAHRTTSSRTGCGAATASMNSSDSFGGS